MIILREICQHGPHYWYCQYLFTGAEVWLNFLGDQKHWALCPRLMEKKGEQ